MKQSFSIKRVAIVLIFALTSVWILYTYGRPLWVPAYLKLRGERTVNDVLTQIGPQAEQRLRPYFDEAKVLFPPQEVALLAFKQERQLELWAREDAAWRFIRSYRILGASGTAGPKLREGDRQVPEGIYKLDGLNPNSSYHLSMRLNYPNDFDRARAAEEGRTNLGGDIFIHGSTASIGCLAMGDEVIEELFVAAALSGWQDVPVIIAPYDFRKGQPNIQGEQEPAWLDDLNRIIANALARFGNGGFVK